MDIRVYDFNFNLLTVMSDVISSSWSLKYNSVGTYEGHFKLGDRISDILLEHTYLILTEGDNQAVCTGKIADTELLICGRTLNWLLTKRVIPPFKTSEVFGGRYCAPTEIIKYVLEKTFTAPPQTDENGIYIDGTVDTRKKVDNFNILPFAECVTLERHFWRNSANTAEEVIADLAYLADLGHRLYFNVAEKSWDFELIESAERELTMSEKNRNLYDVSYTEESEGYASGGWYEDTDDDGEELWRYIGIDDGNSAMMFWETVLSGTGYSEAESALLNKKCEYTVSATASKLKYGQDYNMGDIVYVLVSYGGFERTIKYRIEGVNIWYNENGYGEEPVFKKL